MNKIEKIIKLLKEKKFDKAEELIDFTEKEYEEFKKEVIPKPWKVRPNYNLDAGYIKRGMIWVNTDDIMGTNELNIKRLVLTRFLTALKCITDGTYDAEFKPIELIKIKGKYYVSSDGNNRVIAYKFLNIQRLLARVVEVKNEK